MRTAAPLAILLAIIGTGARAADSATITLVCKHATEILSVIVDLVR
jgi:hypothetical protein